MGWDGIGREGWDGRGWGGMGWDGGGWDGMELRRVGFGFPEVAVEEEFLIGGGWVMNLLFSSS